MSSIFPQRSLPYLKPGSFGDGLLQQATLLLKALKQALPKRDAYSASGSAINQVHVVPAGMPILKVLLHIPRGHPEVQCAGPWVAEAARPQQNA